MTIVIVILLLLLLIIIIITIIITIIIIIIIITIIRTANLPTGKLRKMINIRFAKPLLWWPKRLHSGLIQPVLYTRSRSYGQSPY